MSGSNKLKLSFLLILILWVLLSLSLVSSVDLSKQDSSLKISSEVISTLEDNNSARVFIQITNESADKRVASEIGKENIINDFGTILSATISQEDLSLLKNDSKVESISLVGLKHFSLQDSVPLINATKTWSLKINGINLTGSGQSICIIDTGIDYAHPDLGGCFGNNNVSSPCKVIGGWNTFANNNNITDLNGHGTHVSGIVAANGTIRGVAPDSRIVFIKAYDDVNGGFWDNDIIEAINWCVDNSSIFNISVISMSLGGDVNYTSYCDNDIRENSNLFAAPINAAFAKNISVVVASGNSANYTGISSPACIQNATPVGSSSKTDIISSFSNRNILLQLLAPGESITSTWKDNNYAIASGTSMAAPHVAGAIALFNQYLRLTSQTKDPSQIESIFNLTGKQINDSSSELNFSRIEVYSAILYLINPYTSLTFPSSNIFTNQNISFFNCSSEKTATTYILKNVTFYLWNSTGLVYNESKNISGTLNSSTFNYTFSKELGYSWNCLTFNNNSNYSWAASNFTITYDKTSPVIVLNSPVNDSGYTTSDTISFYYNISENFNTSNCSLIANNQIILTNSTIGNLSSSIFSSTFSAEEYNWSINCSDSAGNTNSSETRNFTVTQSSSGGNNGGGSGGGSRSSTRSSQSVTDNQMILGYTQTIGKSNKLVFNLQDSSNHSLTIDSVSLNSVNLTLASNPLNLTLIVGEDKKINLSSSDYYDLYIKLNSISGVKANLTIQSIYELIIIPEKVQEPTLKHPLENNSEFTTNPKSANNNNYIILISIIVILIILILLFKKIPNKHKRHKLK